MGAEPIRLASTPIVPPVAVVVEDPVAVVDNAAYDAWKNDNHGVVQDNTKRTKTGLGKGPKGTVYYG